MYPRLTLLFHNPEMMANGNGNSSSNGNGSSNNGSNVEEPDESKEMRLFFFAVKFYFVFFMIFLK